MKPTGQDPIRSTIVEIRPNEVYADETTFGDVRLRFSHTLLRLDHGRTRLSHRLEISGPTADEVGPALGPGITEDFPDAMAALLARVAAVFARDNSNIVRLECTPPPEDGTPALGQVLVKATSAEMGDNVGQLDASVRGDAGQISFNGRYIRDALEVIGSPQVDLQLTGDQRPGVLRPVGELETAYLQVIMPMHVAR